MNDPATRRAPSCQDAAGAPAVSVEEARHLVERTAKPLEETEEVTPRAALGRVLAQPIVSALNVPPHRNAAMDGFALRGDDLPQTGARDLEVIGTAWAGRPYAGAVTRGQCVRIMTGAKMPDGTDTVVIQECSEILKDRVRIGSDNRPGQNVRKAGEDIAIGRTVLETGCRLGPAELGLLASLGVAELEVWRMPRVASFSTGDELRSPGEPLGESEIYDSNRYTLYGMLREMGVEVWDLGVMPDEPYAIKEAMRESSAQADCVIATGGVSTGEADHIKSVLKELGTIEFSQVAMRPGRPLTFGRVAEALFFGLPGNPVAVMVTFYQFVRPALLRLMGELPPANLRFTVPCTTPLKKSPGRTEFQRGFLGLNDADELVVRSYGHQGSGILSSMSAANCLIVLSPERGSVEPGELVPVEPFGLLRH